MRTETDASRGFERPNRLAYHPSGKQLALGYLDGAISVVDAVTPSKVNQVCEYHRNHISALRFDPTGRWLDRLTVTAKIGLVGFCEF